MNARLFLKMMKQKLILVVAALFLLLAACKKGEKLPNALPDTHISITQINLSGDDRLRSEVTLYWYGADEDGWVEGYDISMNGTDWSYVTTQDSTFSFSLPFGSDTTDIDFYVRAIDNEDGVDPSPAYLKIPIKNTAPTAIFDSIQTLADTSFIVTTAFLDVQDLDGIENVDSIFFKINNGGWFGLDAETRVITIVPDDPTVNGTVGAQIFKDPAAILVSGGINGLNLGGDNTFYLKARDLAGSESSIDTSKVVFVKRKSTDLLVIDVHPGGLSPSPEEVYAQTLGNVEPNYDRIDLRSNGGANMPRLWSPTFSTFINFYPRLFWYGDASDEGLTVLEDASGAIQAYLNQGGKILINTSFPSSFDNASVLQEYTPLDSVSTSSGTARLPTGNLVMPTAAYAGTFDTLEASAFVGRATPMYAKSTSEVILTGDFSISGGWVGSDVVCAKLVNGAGNTNVVLVTVELHQLFARPAALENFFNGILLNEFNW